jgi:hypothetical protein
LVPKLRSVFALLQLTKSNSFPQSFTRERISAPCNYAIPSQKEELVSASAQQDQDEATRQLALDIYKQLIGINTNPLSGQRNRAYEAFAKRFCDAEFPESDISVLGPNDRKKNIVVCPVGSEEHKPMLLIEHLDATHGGLESFARGADVDHALRSTPFYADHWQR